MKARVILWFGVPRATRSAMVGSSSMFIPPSERGTFSHVGGFETRHAEHESRSIEQSSARSRGRLSRLGTAESEQVAALPGVHRPLVPERRCASGIQREHTETGFLQELCKPTLDPRATFLITGSGRTKDQGKKAPSVPSFNARVEAYVRRVTVLSDLLYGRAENCRTISHHRRHPLATPSIRLLC
ncbi:unnamed protein product [Trichogramma brassicae]|uniref:Uncharacterized protein n=1 Tax=Trichogramma brassicae TaxID=86971 RepID=A0A6H5J3T0_9HYME|nr:unnamed protein product [Trichogramma brassicae]